MSKCKTRVTRMSRRKARTGTRKQSGGFLDILLEKLKINLANINPANWFEKKPENSVPPLDPAAAATNAADVSKKPGAAPDAPDVPDDTNGQDVQGGGARKTRHRRRHHRK
jgi:hypothetical protein